VMLAAIKAVTDSNSKWFSEGLQANTAAQTSSCNLCAVWLARHWRVPLLLFLMRRAPHGLRQTVRTASLKTLNSALPIPSVMVLAQLTLTDEFSYGET